MPFVRVRGCAPADDFGDQGDSYVVHAIRRNERRRSSCASHSKGRHCRSASARHCAARTAFNRWKLLASVLLCVSPWSSVFAQIRAIQEGGRTVFVNDDTVASRPASHAADGNRAAYEYWSNTERRWKPLPPASSSLLRRARDAAAEVQTFAKAAPETKPAMRSLWRLLRTRSARR